MLGRTYGARERVENMGQSREMSAGKRVHGPCGRETLPRTDKRIKLVTVGALGRGGLRARGEATGRQKKRRQAGMGEGKRSGAPGIVRELEEAMNNNGLGPKPASRISC